MIKRTRKTYCANQKIKAVESCLNAGIKKTNINLGIPYATLCKWLKDHRNGIEMTKTKAGRKKKSKVDVLKYEVYLG